MTFFFRPSFGTDGSVEPVVVPVPGSNDENAYTPRRKPRHRKTKRLEVEVKSQPKEYVEEPSLVDESLKTKAVEPRRVNQAEKISEKIEETLQTYFDPLLEDVTPLLTPQSVFDVYDQLTSEIEQINLEKAKLEEQILRLNQRLEDERAVTAILEAKQRKARKAKAILLMMMQQ